MLKLTKTEQFRGQTTQLGFLRIGEKTKWPLTLNMSRLTTVPLMDRYKDHNLSTGSWSDSSRYQFSGPVHEPYHETCGGPQTVKVIAVPQLRQLLSCPRTLPRPVILTMTCGEHCGLMFGPERLYHTTSTSKTHVVVKNL